MHPHFPNVTDTQKDLVQEWQKSIHPYPRSRPQDFLEATKVIMHKITFQAPEVLFGLLVNSSLPHKMIRALRMKSQSTNPVMIAAACFHFQSKGKHLIIGVAALLQLCRLPRRILSPEQIALIEHYKKLIEETIFDGEIQTVLNYYANVSLKMVNISKSDGHRAYPYDLETYLSRFGWFNFAKMNAREFAITAA